jgi:hypothetical protein
LGRVGFDVNAPQQYFFPDADGAITIHARNSIASSGRWGRRPTPADHTARGAAASGGRLYRSVDRTVHVGARGGIRRTLRLCGRESACANRDEAALILIRQAAVDEHAQGRHRGDGRDVHDDGHLELLLRWYRARVVRPAGPSEGLS